MTPVFEEERPYREDLIDEPFYKGLSYTKRLTNDMHAQFANEFLELFPEGFLQTYRVRVLRVVTAELENLKYCRKNHDRELIKFKVKELRSKMSALYKLLTYAAKCDSASDITEKHSYDMKVKGKRSDMEYVIGVNSFILAWQGSSLTSAEELVNEASDAVGQIKELQSQMVLSDKAIANIKPQKYLRAKTDKEIYKVCVSIYCDINRDFYLNQSVDGEVTVMSQMARGIKKLIRRMRLSLYGGTSQGSEENEDTEDTVE